MDVLTSRMHAARAIACAPRINSQTPSSNGYGRESSQHCLPSESTSSSEAKARRSLFTSFTDGGRAQSNAYLDKSDSAQAGSCVTARRRVGRTQRGQDPLSYRIGPFTFHTFRAMNPDNGCLCKPSLLPRCRRPCRRVLEMRQENYLNSLRLIHMPELERRKLIGSRDPVMVLISRAHKYNARFITEKTVQQQHHVFDEMLQMDSIVQMMKETRF